MHFFDSFCFGTVEFPFVNLSIYLSISGVFCAAEASPQGCGGEDDV